MSGVSSVLDRVKRIHFIGIGGAGMCPLAEILHSKGYALSGSDNNETDTLKRVRSLGIPVMMGQRAENIDGAEMIVYSAAIMSDNPELCAAKASTIPTFERAELLGELTRRYNNCVAVAGTHGKTTVTSMITQVMLGAGLDPTAVIGGKLSVIGGNGRVGETENMVCEACEFVDTFLKMYPDVSVILNIDEDHLDYFGTLENIIKSFRTFAEKTTRTLVVNGDDANSLKAVEGLNKEIITFGFGETNDYYPQNISYERSKARFDAMYKGQLLGRVSLNVIGEHNITNALAAIACAIKSGLTFEEIIPHLEKFTGAGRRFEELYNKDGITIVDDYAHHPEELRVTLEAAMNMGYNNVWAVFQPFTFSRTKILFDDFVEVLKIPQKVVMSEIMGSREVNTYGVYTSQLAEKIPGSVWFDGFEEIADYVVSNAQKGDLIITLGCGDIYKAAKIMIEKLENK